MPEVARSETSGPYVGPGLLRFQGEGHLEQSALVAVRRSQVHADRAAIVGPVEHETFALRAWAVDARCPAGVASLRLVGAIADVLRRSGGRRLVACVGDADADDLSTLVAAGFRFAGVERDAALATAARPCDPSRDLVWMDQDL